MEVLHALLRSLNRNELKMVRTSLTCYSSRKERETKALKLFQYLTAKSDAPSFKDCSFEVYQMEDEKKLKKLKMRLKAKILDSLILDVNIDGKENFTELDRATLRVKKKITQFHLLYRTRGYHPLALQLLDEIFALSVKFEIYESIVESLIFKKYFYGFCEGLKDFNKLNKMIAFYEYCDQCRNKANDDYYRLILRTDFNGKMDKASMQEQLKDSIIELNKAYKYTKSANVGYYLKLLELAYFMNNDNYVTGREICHDLLSIIINNKSVYRKQRLGNTFANLCQCNIYLGDYKNAVLDAIKGQKQFPKGSVNYPVLKEQEFYALFFGDKLKESEKAVVQLINISSKKQGNFRLAKYHFLKANVLFKKGNFKGALKILNLSQEISKDKEGWDIAVRILTLMTLIELDRKGEAELQLERFRKHMDKYYGKNKKKDDKERNGIILKILQQLERQSFVFDKKDSKVIAGLTLLSGNDKKYRWECLTPELIPFHEWYAAKAGYVLPKPEVVPPARAKRKKEKVMVEKK